MLLYLLKDVRGFFLLDYSLTILAVFWHSRNMFILLSSNLCVFFNWLKIPCKKGKYQNMDSTKAWTEKKVTSRQHAHVCFLPVYKAPVSLKALFFCVLNFLSVSTIFLETTVCWKELSIFITFLIHWRLYGFLMHSILYIA